MSESAKNNKEIIRVNNLTKKYSDFSLYIKYFDLYKNEIVGLVGENGAGKTTFLSILLSQLEADSGSVDFFDSDFQSMMIKNKIGFVVGDRPQFNPSYTGSQVELILSNIYSKWDREYFRKLVNIFRVPLNKKINSLSKGMVVKLNLSLALAHKPHLLIFDEITSGLDPLARDSVLKIIKEFVGKNDVSVLFSTHITTDIEKIADRIYVIHNGKIVFKEHVKNLATDYYIVLDKDEERGNCIEKYIFQNKKNNSYYELKNDKHELLGGKSDILAPTIEQIMLFIVKGKFKEEGSE